MARRKPKPREQPRQAATRIKKGAFLDAYRKVATISAACRVAGVDRMTHYRWLEADPAYVEAFRDAQDDATDLLEQEARRRAIVGWEEPTVYQGQFNYETDPVTGQRRQIAVRKYDSTLLLALLNAHRPEKFRYRHEHSGPGGGPIPHKHAGQIIVVDGPKDKYMAGLRQAREAVVAAAGGDGHGGDGKPPGDGDAP